jgi:TRAP-type C4-dicarboxylate transport system permease small subunit
MKAFDRALGLISMALAWIACAIIPVLFTMIVVDVSIRTLGGRPPAFTSAIVEYALLYVAMFSAPFLVREKGHVAIEAVIANLPKILQRFLAMLVYITCMLAAALFTYFSCMLFWENWSTNQLDTRSIDVSYWLQFLPMVIGFAMVSLEFLMYVAGRRHYYSYDLGEVKDGV